jgi:hypothetical protein
MAFSHQADLLANVTFRGRVKIAMLVAARARIEAGVNSGWVALGQRVQDAPDIYLERCMAAVIADSSVATAAASDQTGASINDATLQTAVNSALLTLVR